MSQMTKIRNVFALFALLTVAACSESSGTLQLTWTLMQGSQAVSCAQGDQVWVTSVTGSDTYVDKFNCTANSANVSLRPGTYSVTVELRDSSNALVIPGSGAQAVIQSGKTTNLGMVIFMLVGQGSIKATWQLINQANQAISCASVGAVTFELHTTPVGGGATLIDKFNCADLSGTATEIDEGNYNVTVDLLDANNVMKNSVTVSGQVHVTAGQTTQLNNIAFQF
jgi:hypothetical protein